MTYKFQARLRTEWVLENPEGEGLALGEVLRLLGAVEAAGHIAGACRACKVSYRHAWGILRHAEKALQRPLLETSRRQGTKLTRFAQQLLWAGRRQELRLAPVLEGMANDLQGELESLYTESRPRLRMHASHGFAVEGLMQVAQNQPAPVVELRYRTAIEALASLNRGECDLAGFQVPLGEFQQPILQHYQPWLDPERHSLIYLAQRETGLFVQAGNPLRITSVADLAKPGVRFVNRQAGSSTRLLLSLMLRKKGIDPAAVQGFDSSEFTHTAVAAHIVGGMADAGVGVETAAWRCGLDFIHLASERYFFAVRTENLDSPMMREFVGLLRGQAYTAFVSRLAGYDAGDLGRVMSLEEAFGPLAGRMPPPGLAALDAPWRSPGIQKRLR